MGGGGGKSAPAPVYMPPPPDNTFRDFLNYSQQQEARAQARADQERADAAAKEAARKASGTAGFGGLRSGLESQLKQGLITYNDASSQLRDYAGKYEINAEEDVNKLTDLYTKELFDTVSHLKESLSWWSLPYQCYIVLLHCTQGCYLPTHYCDVKKERL